MGPCLGRGQSFLGWNPASSSEAGRAYLEEGGYGGEDASECHSDVGAKTVSARYGWFEGTGLLETACGGIFGGRVRGTSSFRVQVQGEVLLSDWLPLSLAAWTVGTVSLHVRLPLRPFSFFYSLAGLFIAILYLLMCPVPKEERTRIFGPATVTVQKGLNVSVSFSTLHLVKTFCIARRADG